MPSKKETLSAEVDNGEAGLRSAMRFFDLQAEAFAGPPRSIERREMMRQALAAANDCEATLRTVQKLTIMEIDQATDITAALAAIREANKKLNDVLTKDEQLKKKLDKVAGVLTSITRLITLGQDAGFLPRPS
jgi:hypothetical protein